jgi:uracil-DNA glycosylase
MSNLNRLPTVPTYGRKLAIVLPWPSREEEYTGTPFTGTTGATILRILAGHGLSEQQVLLAYVLPKEKSGAVLREDYSDLVEVINAYRPNAILAVGTLPFQTFCGWEVGLKEVENYRGGQMRTDGTTFPQCKVYPTLDGAAVWADYTNILFWRVDIGKAYRAAAIEGVTLPARNINTRPCLTDVLTYLNDIETRQLPASFDVEGYNDNVGVTMLSIAKSPVDCIVIPFWFEGKHYWSEDEELMVWQALARWLANPKCGKKVTNAMYETFIMLWKHKCIIANITEDTMLKQWELFPDHKKGLATQVSLWTEEPYYKDERTSDNTSTKLLYNGKDSCCTEESDRMQELALQKLPRSYEHYRFNVSILPAYSYLQLRGCKFNLEKAAQLRTETTNKLNELMFRIEQTLGRTFNVKSVPDKQWLLYEHFGYKPSTRYGRTTAEEFLLRFYAKHREPLLKMVIEAISLRTRVSDINKLTTDADGRIRSGYNIVGTNTGRLSSSESNAMVPTFSKTGILKWENTGTNLQNVTKELRICFEPDSPNHSFFQCDLSGADGWTVAADLAAIGHSTMLDDYLYGIKPAKVLLLMLWEHNAGRPPAGINNLTRAELLRLTKAIKFPDERDAQGRPGDWEYLCMKRVQHGTNYGMQPELLSATIFKDSEGTIDLTIGQAALYQSLYRMRYNVDARAQWLITQLPQGLQTASGIYKKFYGLRNPRDPEPAIVRAALSFEPQANTTYVTNKALQNLWFDPKNRTSRGTLHIEPLIQIHDALAGQFRTAYSDFAIERLRTWFHNPITIHGIEINIPFEGGFGTDWLNSKSVEFKT